VYRPASTLFLAAPGPPPCPHQPLFGGKILSVVNGGGGVGQPAAFLAAGGWLPPGMLRQALLTGGFRCYAIRRCRVFNATARYVDQAGKRKGAFAIFLEPWHGDVFEFLDLRCAAASFFMTPSASSL